MKVVTKTVKVPVEKVVYVDRPVEKVTIVVSDDYLWRLYSVIQMQSLCCVCAVTLFTATLLTKWKLHAVSRAGCLYFHMEQDRFGWCGVEVLLCV